MEIAEALNVSKTSTVTLEESTSLQTQQIQTAQVVQSTTKSLSKASIKTGNVH